MDYLKHRQRMIEILKREQDYRQHGIVDIVQAHDDIDYLYTQLNLLVHIQLLEDEISPAMAVPSPQGTGVLIECDKCDGTGKLEQVEWK